MPAFVDAVARVAPESWCCGTEKPKEGEVKVPYLTLDPTAKNKEPLNEYFLGADISAQYSAYLIRLLGYLDDDSCTSKHYDGPSATDKSCLKEDGYFWRAGDE